MPTVRSSQNGWFAHLCYKMSTSNWPSQKGWYILDLLYPFQEAVASSVWVRWVRPNPSVFREWFLNPSNFQFCSKNSWWRAHLSHSRSKQHNAGHKTWHFFTKRQKNSHIVAKLVWFEPINFKHLRRHCSWLVRWGFINPMAPKAIHEGPKSNSDFCIARGFCLERP